VRRRKWVAVTTGTISAGTGAGTGTGTGTGAGAGTTLLTRFALFTR